MSSLTDIIVTTACAALAGAASILLLNTGAGVAVAGVAGLGIFCAGSQLQNVGLYADLVFLASTGAKVAWPRIGGTRMSAADGAALSFEERLKIEHACTRLANDYSHFADARRMDAWAELFADDAELVVMGATQRGRAAIRKSVGDGSAGTATLHSNSNIRIDVVSSSEAHGEVCATVFAVPVKDGKAQARDLAPTIIGKYLDVYRRASEGWRFGRREFVATMTRITD